MKVRFFPTLVFVLFISFFALGTARAATISPNIFTDELNNDNNCSLREAVQAVNQGDFTNLTGCQIHSTGPITGSDTITLQGGTPYVLSIPSTDEDNNLDGDIDIQNPVVIQGAGMDVSIVTGGFPSDEEDRIFDVLSEDVSLIGLTISNGGALNGVRPDGAGILNNGGGTFTAPLLLQDVHVQDNFGERGGGITNNNGSIILLQSKVTGNQADTEGGGIFNGDNLAIDESTIDGNTSQSSAGGIDNNGSLAVYNSTISRNQAVDGNGGGIFVASATDNITLVVNSTISTNQTNFDGGGIYVCSTCIESLGDSVGGAGGLPFGVFLFNDTITKNEADSQFSGGGIFFNPPPPPVPITFGQVGATGGVGIGSVGLSNTILAQNTAGEGPDCFSTVESGNFNLFGETTDCNVVFKDSSDIVNSNPGLGPLQNNGGPTETHGLFANSPAIDKGDSAGCQAPDLNTLLDPGDLVFIDLVRDQRNFLRPIAILDPNTPVCDIGAFEFQVFDFTVTKDDGLGGATIPVGTTFDYTIDVTNNGPGTATAVTLNDPLPNGMDFVSVTPSQGTCTGGATISCDLGDLAEGETATITVTVTATETGDFTNVVTITLNNPFQQQLTETAQITTVVGGVFVEGSGIHCGLQHSGTQASPGFAEVLGLMLLISFGVTLMLRRRAHG